MMPKPATIKILHRFSACFVRIVTVYRGAVICVKVESRVVICIEVALGVVICIGM